MRRACTRAFYRHALQRTFTRPPAACGVRPYCSKKAGEGKPPVALDLEEEEEDDDELSFNVAVEEEAVPEVVLDTPLAEEDLTPEMASELVERMVAAASAAAGADSAAYGVGGVITPHTVAVLRAARFTTNEVLAPCTVQADYPLNRKVTASLDVAQLGLSPPAHAALRGIAGSRYKDDRVRIGCMRFRSSEENLTSAVATLEHLVRAAKQAVGEQVDETVLNDWSQVEAEVRKQCGEEVPIDALLKRRDRRDETFIAALPSSIAQ